jgi:N-carbamoyl-L-amino-acid hydrolase
LVTGSHLDTVPTGGRFDGVLGVLAGLEVARTLQASGEQLRHPFELVVFADEESTMVGCKAMVGTASPDPDAYATSNGESIERNLERIGGALAVPCFSTTFRCIDCRLFGIAR